jgi:flagellar biogenesis protein FliO
MYGSIAGRLSSYAGYLLETFVTLVAVCGLAFVVLWGARRLGIGRPSGPIQLRGTLPLDGRRAIHLVQVGAQIIVVGVGEGGFTKLGELPAADLPVDEPARRAAFGDVLSRVMSRPGSRKKEGP